MTQPKDQKCQEHLLIGKKPLMLLIKKNQKWMTATWGVPERSTKVNFLSHNKDYLPNVPEHLELFLFADDKSVAALKGTAENKENQSMQTQNWLTSRKLVMNLNKKAGYHGQLFSTQNLPMMIFRKKSVSLTKIVASTNLPEMNLHKNTDVCGKKRFFKEKKNV